MTYGNYATETLSLVIIGVLLFASVFESPRRTRKDRWFICMLCMCGLGMLSDLGTWFFGSHGFSPLVVTVVTVPSMLATLAGLGAFYFYVRGHLREKGVEQLRSWVPLVAYCAVSCLWTAGASLMGSMFTVVDGYFYDGPCYSTYVVLNAIMIVAIAISILRNARALGLHDTLVGLLYLAIPLVSAVINVFVPWFCFAYESSVISTLIIFVMLQTEHAKHLSTERDLIECKAKADELTGLLNRAAYADKLASIDPARPLGVVFCDLNGLKFTNDNQGHAAGDQLLQDFAGVLQEAFRRDEIFRISGDEFLVVASGISQAALDERVAALHRSMERFPFPPAAVGSAMGTGAQAGELVRQAEERMYQDKARFYEAHPELAR
ncbi:MAG: GGDEF domain-containing protein [Coriobacteriia bacterium]|nr:GGDEF domain-containing protein [Coriobacteriia bacterium]